MDVTGIFMAREDQDLVERAVGVDMLGDCQVSFANAGLAGIIYRKHDGLFEIIYKSRHSCIL